MKCDCTSRAKPFAVTVTDSILDAEPISHGQSLASPFVQHSYAREIRKSCLVTFVSSENFCCDCGSFWAKSGFLRCFMDPIRVPRIENRVPRIRENRDQSEKSDHCCSILGT